MRFQMEKEIKFNLISANESYLLLEAIKNWNRENHTYKDKSSISYLFDSNL